MDRFRILTITHKKLSLNQLGKFVVPSDDKAQRLQSLKERMQIDELLYLQTCNRVTFVFTTPISHSPSFTERLFSIVNPDVTPKDKAILEEVVDVYEGTDAIRHFLSVATSIDSLVIGEREIHKQIRLAYNECQQLGLTGDSIRLLVKHTIEVAKKVFTDTDISKKPVSVVSLATETLLRLKVIKDARILLIGAGNTNTLMGKLLIKNGYRHFAVFNRTLENANILASKVEGTAHGLTDLTAYDKPFDVIISCTGSTTPVLDWPTYQQMLRSDQRKKVIIDLAVPRDVDPKLEQEGHLTYVDVEQLRSLANKNLDFRRQALGLVQEMIEEEVATFERLFHQRQLEQAMRGVSDDVKEIRSRALEAVFAKEVETLDPEARETLDKVLDYMEKKFISIPYTRARQAFS